MSRVYVSRVVSKYQNQPIFYNLMILRTQMSVLHILGQFLQFGSGEFQTLALHMLMGSVREELVKSDDVSRDLNGAKFNGLVIFRMQYHTIYPTMQCAHVSLFRYGFTWNMGYVRKVSSIRPSQAALASYCFRSLSKSRFCLQLARTCRLYWWFRTNSW